MKKSIFAILLILTLLTTFICVASCEPQVKETVNVYVPDGAPALTVASLLAYEELENYKVNVSITTGENVKAKLLSGEADVAICPTNMAATLYNSGLKYKLVTANLFGLLYVVGDLNASKLDDLKGQVVYSIGKSNTPEFVFKKILTANNIGYVDSDEAVEGKVAIRYFDAGSAIIPLLKSGVAHVAILGEPAATKSGAKEIFDIQKLWKDATGLDGYPQAGLFVSENLLQNNAKFVQSLVNILEANVSYVHENCATVAEKLVQHGSVDFNGTTFTATVLDRCNLRCEKAWDCKQQMEDYFEAIKTIMPAFKLPDDGFYAK